MKLDVDDELITRLGSAAWQARDHARILGKTKVGCSAADELGRIFAGCNLEHRFRSHDIHAEIAALSALVSSGSKRVVAVLIAAERERFTPCGACLDWLFELGESGCIVLIQNSLDGPIHRYTAAELMPHYPR